MNHSRDSALEELQRIGMVTDRTYRLVEPRQPLLLAVWGAVYFLGFGAFWVDVRFGEGTPTAGPIALFVCAAGGLLVTALELHKRLHGFGGGTMRQVRRAFVAWGLVVVIWGALVTVYVVSRPVMESVALGTTAAALAVLLIGAWYVIVTTGRGGGTIVGLGLVSVGAAGLVVPTPENAMLVVWLGTSAVFLVGAPCARVLAAREREARLASNG